LIESVDGHGTMTETMGEFAGMFFKEADPHIVADLARKGRIFAAETFTHTYPFCYRCDSPLLYFAISTWFVQVSAIREQLQRTAEDIQWQPSHIKEGRFGKWIESARDWAISRNRYWGAPLPIWINEADENDYLVVTSLDELVKLAGLSGKPEDLHRPGIDEIVIQKDGKTYKRVEEVFDCWFESGSMPVAQQHYPFENKAVFEESFPADYIGEGLDQTRLWFYVLHVLNTIAFDQPAYKNVLVNGMVMAADGQKLSKRLKNYPPVDEVFAQEGADTLRLYLLGNDQAVGGDYMRFNREAMRDISRNVFGTLWNTYSFLSMYAEIDGWDPAKAYKGGNC
jgi:isoleucyl-tRNA synthetase